MTKRDIDWDFLGTIGLTILVGIVTAGLPFLISGFWVLVEGLRAQANPGGDLMVVFGKRLVNDHPDADYRTRLEAAARLANSRPGHHIWILGGYTGNAQLTEAAAGVALLRSMPGGNAFKVSLEEQSRDTLTNLRNFRAHLAGNVPQTLTLITNRYHLARVGLMARSLGLPHEGCAAEVIGSAMIPSLLVRLPMESFFVTWFVTGKLWATMTRNGRMLNRVT